MSHDKKKPPFSVVRLSHPGPKTDAEKDALIVKFWRKFQQAKVALAEEEKQLMKEFLDENNIIH